MAGGGPPIDTTPTRDPHDTATLPTRLQGQSVQKPDKLRHGGSRSLLGQIARDIGLTVEELLQNR